MRSRWLVLAVVYIFYLSTLAFAEVRLVTQPDISWGKSNENTTSLGSHVGGKIPRFFDNNAFTDNLALYGKSVTGDNTGNISGFDNGTFANVIYAGDIRRFGASTSATAVANTTAIQAAIDNSTEMLVYVPPGTFRCNTITLGTSNRLVGAGVGISVLSIDNTTGNGIEVAAGGASKVSVSDLTLMATTSSTGIGIYSSGALIEGYFDRMQINNFNDGVWLKETLSVKFNNVRMSLRGKDKAGTTGIKTGTDDTTSGNKVRISDVYIGGVETCTQSWAFQTTIDGLICETAVIGIKVNNRTTVINPWISTDNTNIVVGATRGALTAIGFMNQSVDSDNVVYETTAIRDKSIVLPAEYGSSNPIRFGPNTFAPGVGWNTTKLRVYRNAALTDNTADYFKITTDAENWDEQSEHNTSTGVVTLIESGWYLIQGQVRVTTPADNTRVNAAIYVDNVAVAYGETDVAGASAYPSAFASTFYYASAVGKTIELYGRITPASGTTSINTGSTNTYLQVMRIM